MSELWSLIHVAVLDWHIEECSARFCTAGERDNDDFLLHYGFVPPGNPHDSVLLFPSLGAALEWYFDHAAPQVCHFCCSSWPRG
jgi:hypothetical protein